MLVHHQEEKVVSDAITASFGGAQETIHFGLIEKVLSSFVKICGDRDRTIYISPFGNGSTPFLIDWVYGVGYLQLFTIYAYCKKCR
jgi:hypothetical protein